MPDVDIEDLAFNELEVPTVEIEPVELTTEQLQEKIAQLSTTIEGEDLKFAMRDLKKALLANPAACVNLLPSDIGAMVAVLQKITGKDSALVEEKAARKEAKATKPKKYEELDPNFLASIKDEDLL